MRSSAAGEIVRAATRSVDIGPSPPAHERASFGGVIGASVEMRCSIRLRAHRTSSVSVIIEGETGTGKEVPAEAIHGLESRPGPFVVC
jgi:DNA-binding NtrC family response regulator